ncbi:MAG TPA: protein kinase [Streptosporangiaceae bacterium]|nr:protein kinase [Streptosporangiaceae bacterium]
MPRSRLPPAGRYQLSDRYRLDSWIAAGGVGEVWRGVDTVLDRAVAVKLLREEYVLDAQARARFRAEAKHAGALCHPGIAQIYDYAETDPDDPPFLVMELVEGPSLATVLASGPLDPCRAMDVVAQTAAGLQAAHEAGLIHRDIKPANLLLTPAGQVKITDFGIAYAAGSAPLTRTGLLVGTPAYLAPERATGASATAASDLYSLGIVAFECLTGTAPFTGVPLEVATAHRHSPLPPLPTAIPPQVAALVQGLTSKDPADRPTGAGQVADRAGRLRDSLTSPTGSAWLVDFLPGPAVAAVSPADPADPLAAWASSPLAAPVSPSDAPPAGRSRLLADTGDAPVVNSPPGMLASGSPALADPLGIGPADGRLGGAASGIPPNPADPLAAGLADGPPRPWRESGGREWPARGPADPLADSPVTRAPADPLANPLDPRGPVDPGAARRSPTDVERPSQDADRSSAAPPATVAYARPNRFAPAEPSRYSGRHASPGSVRPGDTLSYSTPTSPTSPTGPIGPGGHGAEGGVHPGGPWTDGGQHPGDPWADGGQHPGDPRTENGLRPRGPRGFGGPRVEGGLHSRGLIGAALAAVALIAALGIWLFSGSHGRAPSAPTSSPQPSHNAAGPSLVRVSPRLIGQNVRVVTRRLRALGLRVSVLRQANFEVPPGTVVGLTPTGKARPGTLITLTVATAAKHPGHHGHGDNGNGNGNGKGKGGGKGNGND